LVDCDRGKENVRNVAIFELEASTLQEFLCLAICIFEVASIRIDGESRKIIFSNILEVHVLLDLHQPVHAFLVHDVFIDEVSEKLEVEFDHLEVD
jgi:hypothetical protein